MLPGPFQSFAQGQIDGQEEALTDLYVSAYITAAHLFVQLPLHPSFAELPRFQQCLNQAYTHLVTPYLPEYAPAGLLCVAYSDGTWWLSLIHI